MKIAGIVTKVLLDTIVAKILVAVYIQKIILSVIFVGAQEAYQCASDNVMLKENIRRKALDKLILEVYVRQTLDGPQIAFKWPPQVREGLEHFDLMPSLGEALAQFGEQLKMEGLGLSNEKPALLYGPNGRPVA